MTAKYPIALAALACACPAFAQDPAAPQASAFDVHALEPVNMPLVALPLDLTQKSAPIWIKGDKPKDAVLARVTLRPAETIAVEAELGQAAGKPLILSRTLFAPAIAYARVKDIDSGKAKKLYCGAGTGLAFAGRIVCLEDADGDGKLEGRRFATAESGGAPEQVSIVGKAEPLAAPVGYRAARAEEVVDIEAVYSNCAKDHDRPRYTFAVRQGGSADMLKALLADAQSDSAARRLAELRYRLAMIDSGGGTCTAADSLKPGDAHYPAAVAKEGIAALLGELVVEVGSKDAGAPVRLVAMRTPDRLYRLAGRAVVPLFDTVTEKQNQLAVAQKFDKPVVMTTGAARIFEGERGVGDVVLTAGFQHGYMGVLTQDTTIRTLFSSRSVPKGATVYGVPMSTRTVMTINGIPQGPYGPVGSPRPGQVRLVWCVPVEEQGQWSATCLPDQGGRYTLLKGQKPAFEVKSFTYDAGTSSNDGVVPVVAQAGSFGKPLSLRFTLTALSANEITLAQDTLYGDTVINSRVHRVARAKGMTSGMSFGGGGITFAEAPGGKVLVKTFTPIVPGAAIEAQFGIVRAATPAPPAQPAPQT